LNQGSGSEVGRAALAVVAELLAKVESLLVGGGQEFASISAALKDGANELFVFPRKPSHKNSDLLTLFGVKKAFQEGVDTV